MAGLHLKIMDRPVCVAESGGTGRNRRSDWSRNFILKWKWDDPGLSIGIVLVSSDWISRGCFSSRTNWPSCMRMVRACHWIMFRPICGTTGVANGNKTAYELRENLAKQMPPIQISETQKLVREWRPKGKE
jgi:hypothetical protein